MKKNGFTLIELLIVTVVIVTLMGIVFRLAGVGGDSRAQAKTLARLQRIENALSGYYAAYGSYPPVPLQGRSRSIDVQVDENGVQGAASDKSSASLTSRDDTRTIKQVEAACRAQPVAVLYPFSMLTSRNDGGMEQSDTEVLVSALKQYTSGNFSYLRNIGGLDLDETEWNKVNVFQFGLLSFLLPRYLFMLQGDKDLYDHVKSGTAKRTGQWAANNQLPCRLDTGKPYESWEDMQKKLFRSGGYEAAMVSNLTSQAVCARWMPNFEKIISGGLEFYGVDTADPDTPYLSGSLSSGMPGEGRFRQFSSGGYNSSSSPYILDGMTILDGWGNEFYYYSPPPYQSYRLWSAGPNKRTFPPWYDLNSFNSAERKTITEWTKDDLMHLER